MLQGEKTTMSKTRLRLIGFAASMSIMLALTGCKGTTDIPATYAKESAATETITLVPTHSVKWKLASFFHEVPHFGIFEMKSARGTVNGTYSYQDEKTGRQYSFEASDKTKWSATMLPDGTLRDKQGNVWHRQKEAAIAKLKHDLTAY